MTVPMIATVIDSHIIAPVQSRRECSVFGSVIAKRSFTGGFGSADGASVLRLRFIL